jgi:mannitol/fructose-specific phosphotransferase system IIA component (Ntr-type)
MRLRDFIADDAVSLALTGASQDAVLEALVRLLHQDERSAATLLRILRRRENLGSTGVGRGIAIPHCRSLVSTRLRVAFGRHRDGVEWQAIDGRPARFFFLIVAPPVEMSNQYLPVLGRIAQFGKEGDISERLAALVTPADFLALVDSKGV